MSVRRFSYLGLLTASVISFSGAVSAQESVFEKDRPDYKADGVRVGAFKLKPVLSVEEKFDDNIFSSNTAEMEDYITVIRPSLGLESNWSRHALNAYAKGDFGIYNDNSSENYEDYSVGLNGRVDALRDTFITGGIDFKEKHEDRGSPDSNSAAVDPTEYNEFAGRLGFYRGQHKVSLRVEEEFKHLDFDDGITAANAIINNDDRDRDQSKTSVRVGYEFIPDYEAFIKGVYNVRSYDEPEDVTGLYRDSDGYEVTVGSSVNISGKAKGEVFVGYMKQEYDASTLNDIDDIAFGANLLWNATQLTSLRAGVARTVEETTTTNSSGYISTSYTVSAEHELRRNILLGASLGFVTNDYESNTAIERSDDIGLASAEAKYLINRNATFKVNYSYQDRDSNIANQDYTKNTVMAGVQVAF